MAPVDGARLTRIGHDIWVADRELLNSTGPVPIRMVVLRGPERRLLCYGPAGLDTETLEALDGLGQVNWLAVPNRHRLAFLDENRKWFPSAQVIGCSGCRGEVENLAEEGQVGGFVDYRVVRASQRLVEVVLYHDASETLVVCDLLEGRRTGPARWLPLTRFVPRPRSPVRLSRDLRSSEARAGFYRWAMARPFRRIILARGSVVREGAREVVYHLLRTS